VKLIGKILAATCLIAFIHSCDKEPEKRGPQVSILEGNDTLLTAVDSILLTVLYAQGDAKLDSLWVYKNEKLDTVSALNTDVFSYKQVFEKPGQYNYKFRVRDIDTLIATVKYTAIVEKKNQ